MKKIVMIALSVAILIGGGVGLALGLNKGKDLNLSVQVYDVSLSVGENKTIEYECSNPNAVISFEIANSDIAIVEYIAQVPTLKGLSAGTTTITIVAKYKKFTNRATANVVVSSGSVAVVPAITLTAMPTAQINENAIVFSKTNDAYVSFNVENVSVSSWAVGTEDANIEVSKYTAQSQMIKLSCDTAGEYTIKLVVNETYEYEISVIVNE